MLKSTQNLEKENKFKIEDFDIKKENIKADLTQYLKFIDSWSFNFPISIKTKFNTIDDYFYIIYYLRFERNLGYKEIAEILYPEIKSKISKICYEYELFGLSYSSNFDECEKNFFNKIKRLNDLKEKSYMIDLKEFDLSEAQYIEYYKALEKFEKWILERNFKCESDQYLKLGYKTPRDYVKAFYYYAKICNLSTFEVGFMYNFSRGAALNRLKILGLSMNRKTSQKNARRNYKNTIITGRQTINNNIIKTGVFGSNIENIIRNKFTEYLSKYISKKKYEVVVGINNQTIIAPKEIDIPIIIIDTLENKIFKFAIEINGECYHKDAERERNKTKILKGKKWNIYTIWQLSNTKNQREFGEVNQQIIIICNEMKKILKGNCL